jgi:hypothetical protein
MSNIEIMLIDEYMRALRRKEAYNKEISNMPKGSIQVKNKHFYLCYRDGGKVVSKYVKAGEVDEIKRTLAERKRYEYLIKRTDEDIRFIEKSIGRKRLYEYITGEGIFEIHQVAE